MHIPKKKGIPYGLFIDPPSDPDSAPPGIDECAALPVRLKHLASRTEEELTLQDVRKIKDCREKAVAP